MSTDNTVPFDQIQPLKSLQRESISSTGRVFSVFGMTCANCARGLEKYLLQTGMAGASVRYPDCTLHVPKNVELSDDEILTRVQSQGFKAVEYVFANKGRDFNKILSLFIISLICTLPMLLGMVFTIHWTHNPYIQLALALPPFVIALHFFGLSAWKSIIRKAPNMDVLITLGVSTSFFYSLIGLVLELGPKYLFFETSASITTFVLLGNLLERRAIVQTRSNLDELHLLTPPYASKLSENGEVIKVKTQDLLAGDHIRLVSGDRIPADAAIVNGHGLVDESVLTGESRPIEKNKTDDLFAGTYVAQGLFEAIIRASGERTVLAEIVRSVEQALQSLPPVQRSADKVATIFVPTVLALSVITFLINMLIIDNTSESLLRAIAVLVIACPCAVGLATPTAVMVGLGRLAKMGILCRSGISLEQLAKVKHIIFDKTGTLTLPDLKIASTKIFHHNLYNEVEPLLRSISEYSRHPYSQTLKTLPVHSNRQLDSDVHQHSNLSIETVNEFRGVGLECKLSNGKSLQVGGQKIIAGHTDPTLSHYDLFIRYDGETVVAFTVDEQIRSEVPILFAELTSMDIQYSLLSGDRPSRVEHFADTHNISEFTGGVSPLEKVQKVEEQTSSHTTAFIGDGINDGPALSAASVGISIGGASQVSLNSAKILLLTGGLTHLVDGIRTAKITLRTIHENLFWAFIYNVCAIPFAAVGLLSPMIAAFTMAFSDIVVIGNSMRLKKRKLSSRDNK